MPKNFHKQVILVVIVGILFSFYALDFLAAQEKGNITLTISPPLVSVKLNPGEKWSSSVKLVNNNSEAVNVYVQANDFKSNEQGMVEFIQNETGSDKYSLVKWLEYATGSIAIAAQETKDIIFTIHVPLDAEPGGHYAAIMASTEPAGNFKGSGIRISSALASLILLEVNGNINEQGEIKEFSSDKKIYSNPKIKFNVIFSNSGNVHLQPRGEIKIYNIFNKEVGSVPINQQTVYGNVFPESQRKWEFIWNGQRNIFDMGRFKAVLFLSYGDKTEVATSRTIYFWVIYYKSLLLMLLGLIALIAIIMLSIRRYVKRAIIRAQVNAGVIIRPNSGSQHKISIIPEANGSDGYKTDVKIFSDKNKIVAEDEDEEPSTFKKFFWGTLSALVLVMGTAAVLYYKGYLPSFGSQKNISNTTNNQIIPAGNSVTANQDSGAKANDKDKSDSVGISGENETVTSTTSTDNLSEGGQVPPEVVASDTSTSTANIETEQLKPSREFTLIVLNGSGQEGAAKRAQDKIISAGFEVDSIGNADNYDYLNTVIKYKEKSLTQVENIKEIFGKNVELQEITEGQADIMIIIGKNFK